MKLSLIGMKIVAVVIEEHSRDCRLPKKEKMVIVVDYDAMSWLIKNSDI